MDFPGDLLNSKVDESELEKVQPLPPPPLSLAPNSEVKRALQFLKSAKNPLVIVGKGAAYSQAEANVQALIEQTGFPFLPTAMGKGVISDENPHCVSAARSLALQKADVILLLGARLNWMLHFGRPPRFSPDVKIIQVDVEPEEFHSSVSTHVPLLGDVNSITGQLVQEAKEVNLQFSKNAPWWDALDAKKDQNRQMVSAFIADQSIPLNYYAVLSTVQNMIPKDSMIVNEGANTMDIGRTVLLNRLPRHRLDAGTYGTMGVGLGYAIAAALHCKNQGQGKRVINVQGDSAFGFGAMEIETAFRYKLPIITVM